MNSVMVMESCCAEFVIHFDQTNYSLFAEFVGGWGGGGMVRSLKHCYKPSKNLDLWIMLDNNKSNNYEVYELKSKTLILHHCTSDNMIDT